MKSRMLAIAMGLSLAVSAARANDILAITETGENFNDLVATFNGAPLNIMLTGSADNWTVELPSGFSISITGQTGFAEPGSGLSGNLIFFTQPTFLIWQSEVPGSFGPGPLTFPSAGTGPTGMFFDLVLADSPARAVPDTSSTLSLLGMSLAGLAYFARIRKVAA
jgi:VPDSG-CTERM motif